LFLRYIGHSQQAFESLAHISGLQKLSGIVHGAAIFCYPSRRNLLAP